MTTISAGAAAGLLVALMVMATNNQSHGAELTARTGAVPFQPTTKAPAPAGFAGEALRLAD